MPETRSCPSCQAQNAMEAAICTSCGIGFPIICPNCSTENPLGSNFCNHCGSQLAQKIPHSDPPGFEPIQAPPGGHSGARPDSALAQRVGQRRPVTIVFCDIKGSTSLAEQVDPEEWAELVREAYGVMIPAIERYEGTIARLMGDGVLAFFGAPTAHEDDPYRAVRASLEILRDYQPFQHVAAKRLRRMGVLMDDSDFDVRIGIHTGLVVVGRIGAGASVEYTAMGDATNLARRMQESANPGEIRISQETYREVATLVIAESLGGIKVKGKQNPVDAFRVSRLRPHPVWNQALLEGGGPLVGRVDEKEALSQLVDKLRQGEGSIVSLIGEAGLGKTRLVQEIMAVCHGTSGHADEQGAPRKLEEEFTKQPQILCYETISRSFETVQPYAMIRRLLLNACGVSQEDHEDVIQQNLGIMLETIPEHERPPIERAVSFLFPSRQEPENTNLLHEDARDELQNGLTAFWRIQASRYPTILIFEDTHWADPASIDLLSPLLRLCSTTSLMFVLVLRSDAATHVWNMKSAAEQDYPDSYEEIILEPLLPWDSDRLAADLLGTDQLEENLRSFIQEKTEGNPFFIQELVSELVDRRAIDQERPGGPWRLTPGKAMVGIPDSLQSLLLARVDRLDRRAQKTLQYASVIGRTFNLQVLKRTMGEADELQAQLATLQEKSLIHQISFSPEIEYSFDHTIVQEAVYSSILRKDRSRYHHQVGTAMENIFPDRLDQVAPLLAYHFEKAGVASQALNYFSLAGENAMTLYANAEAVDHFTHALRAGRSTPIDAAGFSSIARKRALAYEMSGDFDSAREDYQKNLDLGESTNNANIAWRALLDLGKLWTARDYNQAEHYFNRALEIARDLEQPELLARSLNRTGNWMVNAERPREGFEYHKEALEIVRTLEDEQGLANTLDLLGMASLLSADPQSAAHYFQEASELFREQGNRIGLASSLTSLALTTPSYENLTVLAMTDYERSRRSVLEALQICREIGWYAGEAYALFSYATLLASEGKFSPALNTAYEGLELSRRINHKQWMSASLLTLGLIHLEFELFDQAKGFLKQGIELAREIDSRLWISLGVGALAMAETLSYDPLPAMQMLDEVLRPIDQIQAVGERSCWLSRAVLAIVAGDPAYAVKILDHLIDTVPNNEADQIVPWLVFFRGDALRAKGDLPGATEEYLHALDAASERGPVHVKWRINARLSVLYAREGDERRAELHHKAARSTLNAICDYIDEVNLRERFEARAERNLSTDD